MKAVQPVPHGKFEWPRWHPERHHTLQHVLGGHRASVVLAGFAVIVAIAVIGAIAALTPARPTASTAAVPQSAMFAAFRASAVGGDAMSLTALRKVFDRTELAAIAAARTDASALRASRQDERVLDRQLKAQRTGVTTRVNLDSTALAEAKAEQRALDRQMQAHKSGAEMVTAAPKWFVGKRLPL